jgi:phosphatidylserine/phosphatidylglycerophosphate/cardiolipin synthase-like enzyme
MPVEMLDGALLERSRSIPTHDSVAWLVDNARAYEAILHSIRNARRSIWISQLAFDADCVAYGAASTEVSLLDTIVDAAGRTLLDVRILLNESLLLDTAATLRAALVRRGPTGIEVRGISRFPQLLHAKLLIVDGCEAFVLGSPFVNGYWDDDMHRPVDARRPARELGGRPLHDLSVRVTGTVVRELGDIFDELWEDVSGKGRPMTNAWSRERAALSDGGATRAIATVPRHVLPREPDGRAEILAAMERGIARARSLMYIEHQYLSSRKIVDALVAAVRRSPALEVIVLLNQNPDVTAYRGWQKARLSESGLLAHPRVGLFTLWSAELRDAGVRALNQVFVHSKVIVVDDVWATVGSANVDGVSLHSYGDDFESRIGKRVFRNVRNFDVNLEMTDDGDGSIRELRRLLWSEHLGEDVEHVACPQEGWLHLWRARAAANVAALNTELGTSRNGSFVLPYSVAATPEAQLADIGVTALDAIDLRFKPSWLEVHCSPNWIRNMFA